MTKFLQEAIEIKINYNYGILKLVNLLGILNGNIKNPKIIMHLFILVNSGIFLFFFNKLLQ